MLEFPKISDPRGNLSFIEGANHIPFDIKRVYYVYDIHNGSGRAGHAHRNLQQVLIAISGSFDVVVTDGTQRKTVHLDRPNYGFYLPSMIWRELNNFTAGAVCLVLASDYYDESDYYRHYNDFLFAKSEV